MSIIASFNSSVTAAAAAAVAAAAAATSTTAAATSPTTTVAIVAAAAAATTATNATAIATKLLTTAAAQIIRAATTTTTATTAAAATTKAANKANNTTTTTTTTTNNNNNNINNNGFATIAAPEEYFQLYDDNDENEAETEADADAETEEETSFIEGISDWLASSSSSSSSSSGTSNNNNGSDESVGDKLLAAMSSTSDGNDNEHSNNSSLLLNIWHTLIGGSSSSSSRHNWTNATTMAATATTTRLTQLSSNDTLLLTTGDNDDDSSWPDDIDTFIGNNNNSSISSSTEGDSTGSLDLLTLLHANISESNENADDTLPSASTTQQAHGSRLQFRIRYANSDANDDDGDITTTTTTMATTTTTTISTSALESGNGTTYYFRTAIGQLSAGDNDDDDNVGLGHVAAAGAGAGAEGNADVDIALINSAESGLEADSDYSLLGFNGGGGGIDDVDVNAAATAAETSNDLIQRSLAYNADNSYGASHNRTVSTLLDGVTDFSAGTSAGAGVNLNGAGVNNGNGGGGGSTFMLLLEDFGEYFYNYNGSTVSGTATATSATSIGVGVGANLTTFIDNRTLCTNLTANGTAATASCYDLTEVDHNYWALILILFPILTLFGNILVILSVCRERSLQTVTNYFIVSLAIADLLVAVVVMPFAVYVLVNGIWALPNVVCDFYIAMDVICSTSSIFNLVAISIDRYIAVTQPIKYAKHKNSRRVCLTILLVWAISAAIGSPIVLGLNNTPNRDPDVCAFYNADFILYSSLSSFYIPCIIMVFLYWNIFKALRSRARKQRAARKPHLSELTGGSVIENIAQTRRLAETALDSTRHASRIMPDEQATNTASGSNEEEDENAISPDIDDCHVIVNDKSTEFMLATVVEETGNVVAQITTQPQLVVADPNGNHDSGYAPSNVDDVLAGGAAVSSTTPPDSPIPSGATLQRSSVSSRRNAGDESPKRGEPALSVAMKPLSFVRYGVQEAMTLARNDSTLSTTSKTSSRKDKKNSHSSRFTIYKVHKASKKKREKSSAKKERKATKTLAIVLGVFLFCWLPFFSCNIMDAMCAKFNKDCRPGVTAYILTTWLGYINSFVNPVIYTIFNPEFRKAFKKIMHMG